MTKLSLKTMIAQAMMFGLTFAGLMALSALSWGEKFNKWQFLYYTIFYGLIMGIVVPIITARLTKKALNSTNIALEDNEEIVFEGAATLKNESLSIGGKLALTSKRLVFKSHKPHGRSTLIEIPIHQIIKVEQRNTFGFIRNILIIHETNESFKFMVFENERAIFTSKIAECQKKIS